MHDSDNCTNPDCEACATLKDLAQQLGEMEAEEQATHPAAYVPDEPCTDPGCAFGMSHRHPQRVQIEVGVDWATGPGEISFAVLQDRGDGHFEPIPIDTLPQGVRDQLADQLLLTVDDIDPRVIKWLRIGGETEQEPPIVNGWERNTDEDAAKLKAWQLPDPSFLWHVAEGEKLVGIPLGLYEQIGAQLRRGGYHFRDRLEQDRILDLIPVGQLGGNRSAWITDSIRIRRKSEKQATTIRQQNRTIDTLRQEKKAVWKELEASRQRNAELLPELEDLREQVRLAEEIERRYLRTIREQQDEINTARRTIAAYKSMERGADARIEELTQETAERLQTIRELRETIRNQESQIDALRAGDVLQSRTEDQPQEEDDDRAKIRRWKLPEPRIVSAGPIGGNMVQVSLDVWDMIDSQFRTGRLRTQERNELAAVVEQIPPCPEHGAGCYVYKAQWVTTAKGVEEKHARQRETIEELQDRVKGQDRQIQELRADKRAQADELRQQDRQIADAQGEVLQQRTWIAELEAEHKRTEAERVKLREQVAGLEGKPLVRTIFQQAATIAEQADKIEHLEQSVRDMIMQYELPETPQQVLQQRTEPTWNEQELGQVSDRQVLQEHAIGAETLAEAVKRQAQTINQLREENQREVQALAGRIEELEREAGSAMREIREKAEAIDGLQRRIRRLNAIIDLCIAFQDGDNLALQVSLMRVQA